MSQATVTNDRPLLQHAGAKWWTLPNLWLHAAVATCLFAGLLAFYGSIYSVHQDLASSALSSRLVLALGADYRDYITYFPPAERIWFSIAVQVSDLTGLRLDLAVVAMTAAIVLVSTGFAYWIRKATVGASPLFLVIPAAVLVILPILFKNVFGLREHMVALGLWPYLVLRASDPEGSRMGRPVRLAVGAWMGSMLLFKYFYAIVIFLVEVADAVVQRRPRLLFRVENIVAGAVVALYLFFWLILDPSQRAAIGAVKSAIDANLADPTSNAFEAFRSLYLAAFLLLASRVFKVPVRVSALGVALVVGAVIAAWAQKRWYSHHLFPITLAYIAWAWLAGRKFKWWVHAIVALCLVFPIVTEYRNTRSYQESVRELDDAMSSGRLSVAGKRVGILTMHPSPYNQYLASHGALRWNASANNSQVASELQPFDRKENARIPPPPIAFKDPGRQMLHDEMLRLWEDMPPDVLILDHSTRWPLRYIDVEWTHVFSQDARFNAILKRYRPVMAHRGKRLEFRYFERAEPVSRKIER